MRVLVLLVRRHSRWILVWLGACGALAGLTVSSYADTYASESARRAAVTAAQQATASTLLYGHLLDPGTPAQMYAWEIGSFLTLLAAVVGILLASRLTRDAEADGTLELLRSTGVRPGTALAAGSTLLLGVSAVLGLVVTLGAGAHRGVPGVTWGGATCFGGCVAITCLMLGATTGLLAQLISTPRGVRGAAFTGLGVWFAMRAAGDVRDTAWLSDLSPLGLRGAAHPFSDDLWAPIVWWTLTGLGMLCAATFLASRRELHAAPVRPRDRSSDRLPVRHLMGLDVHLERGAMLAWGLALAATGALLAAMGSTVIDSARAGRLDGGVLGTQVGSVDPVRGYFTYLGTLVAVVVSVFALLTVHRAATAERSGAAALLRSVGVRASGVLASTTLLALTGSLAMLLVAGGSAALAARLVLEAPDAAGTALRALLSQWPAVVAVTGIGALVVGMRPRWDGLIWVPLVASAVLTLLGALLGVPETVMRLSAFGHAPREGIASSAQVMLLAIGAAACLLSLVAAARRDIQG